MGIKKASILTSLLAFSLHLFTVAEASTTTVGVAEIDLTPPVGVPLAGFGGGKRRIIPWDVFNKYPYATFLTPSKGVRDAIRAKVFFLEKGSKKLVFVSVDLVGVTEDIRSDVLKKINEKLYLANDELFIGATHTHSGPGTISKNPAWQVIATDLLQKKIRKKIIQGIADAVLAANANKEAAELRYLSVDATGLTKNRRIDNGPVDTNAGLILAKTPMGEWLGGVVNFAVHGTGLKAAELLYSADVPGAVERELENLFATLNGGQSKPVFTFMNGAEGDVTPIHGGPEGMEFIGKSFADRTSLNLKSAVELEANWEVQSSFVKVGKAGIPLKACIKQKTLKKLFSNKAKLLVSKFFPEKTRVWKIKLGHLIIGTWPGEPTTQVGELLKTELLKNSEEGTTPLVFGLTNDHLSYFTTNEEFKSGSYEACSSLYGPQGATRILKAFGEFN